MLYYLLFWAILGFIIHLYITFGTNLLTGVLCLFQCFEEKEYQTESKRNEINWRSYFWKESHPMDLECTSGDLRAAHEGIFHPYIPSYPKTFRTEPRSGVPPPQASVATKSQSGPCPGTLPEGGSLTGGHLHHPGALHDEEGVVHPRGWGYVPVAMCLISLWCSWFGTILMYRELCYYSWILWCFSPSTLL